MVDSHSESYAVQERELRKLLPNVSPDVIKHFLTQVNQPPFLLSHPHSVVVGFRPGRESV